MTATLTTTITPEMRAMLLRGLHVLATAPVEGLAKGRWKIHTDEIPECGPECPCHELPFAYNGVPVR